MLLSSCFGNSRAGPRAMTGRKPDATRSYGMTQSPAGAEAIDDETVRRIPVMAHAKSDATAAARTATLSRPTLTSGICYSVIS